MAANEDGAEPARGPATALGLGERLRSARKAKALSVRQVAESLRLEEPGVIALEEGRFADMGAPVFVRGHLRRYAQLVGLSPETVLDAYRAATPDSDAPPLLARPRAQADAVRLPTWAYWVAGAVAVIGLMVALGGGEEEPPPAAIVAPATMPAPSAPTPPAPLLPQPDPSAPPAPTTDPAATPGLATTPATATPPAPEAAPAGGAQPPAAATGDTAAPAGTPPQ